MAEYRRPLPRIRELTKEFWTGCKKHELRIQRCKDCGKYRFPPQIMCRSCNSLNSEWSKVSGKGKIYSYIIPHRNGPGELPVRGFDYPYAVILVELPDAGSIHIPSNIMDCELTDIKVGMPVEVVFEDVTDEITLPKFRPSA